MQSVNIHLKLSGTQQLRFLEELVSMLHSNGDIGEASAVHKDDVDLAVDDLHKDDTNERGLGAEQMFRTAKHDGNTQNTKAFQHSCEDPIMIPPSSRIVSHNERSPLFSNFIFPHPSSSAPPDKSAPRFQRARRVRRCSVEVDPSLYLNDAELALVSTESPILQAPLWSVLRRSEEFEKGGNSHKSDYWLKESSGYLQQQWLKEKDRACLLQRQEELKKRRKEHRECEEEAAKARERAEVARKAYGSWLQRKRAELRKQKKAATFASPQDQIIDKPTYSSTQKRSLSRSSSAPRKIRHYNNSPPTPTFSPQQKASASKKKVTFEEWLQLKDSKRRSKNRTDQSVPEDLQMVAREMRKMRLQQKEYSKKRVDSGIAKKRVDSGIAKKRVDSGIAKAQEKPPEQKSPTHCPLKSSTALSNVV